ncbi:5-oxoprolinase subunit PxpB [Lysobacter enzymogenes]|uniref:5-oxoprolinase subunit PxpB n=1 Tax=Lysobacter enzymogenes TaxID=69 RepID=UPI0018E09585|nr:5-oxoprolinase subunit PxpB [Lysobacter enzymogenes]
MNERAREAAAAVRFEALADDAWLLRLGERIDDALNARVHALAARVRAQAPPWLRDLVPAYASLAVFFDAQAIQAEAVRAWLLRYCEVIEDDAAAEAGAGARTVEIPVAYGGEFGPDLDTAAAQLQLTPAQLIQRHSGGDYRVAMIGFAPGFPYLSGLEPALALPRLATPRTQVAAGSVAIGGAQTGIYPRPGPGGWRLLGRTPLRLFDAARAAPSLLQPGDHVRLRAIGADEFHALAADADAAAVGDRRNADTAR